MFVASLMCYVGR